MVLGYHYPEYRSLLLDLLQPGIAACYLGAWDAAGQLCGVLPGMLKRANGYACYNSLPFFGPNVGPLASPQHPEYRRIAAELIDSAIAFARDTGALTAAFYGSFVPAGVQLPSAWTFTPPDFHRVAKTTLYLTLPEDGVPRWPSVRRRNIRKARSAGVWVTTEPTDAQLARLVEIYHENCRDYGIPPKPARCIWQIARKLRHRATVYAALLDGEPIAGLIVFWAPQTVSYYLPCIEARYRALHPGTLLVNAACTEAVASRRRYFNFESSPGPDSGVYRYKKAWGSLETGYEIAVGHFCSVEKLRTLGREGIGQLFPYFFVYPFEELD
jgi:hypothetical protein